MGLFSRQTQERRHYSCPQKSDKQLLKEYRPKSLSSICRKVQERLLYNSMLEFLMQNNLIQPNQSDFNPLVDIRH